MSSLLFSRRASILLSAFLTPISPQEDVDDPASSDVPDVAINFKAPNMKPTDLRKITSAHVHKLLKTPGIIISATRIRSKARTLSLTCKGCSATQKVTITDPYGTARLPSRCTSGGSECGLQVREIGLGYNECESAVNIPCY